MRARFWDIIALASIAAGVASTALVYERLPDPMPTHFDLEGTPNQWMARSVACALSPIVALALWTFTRFVRRVLPTTDKNRLDPGVAAFVACLVAVFLSILHVVVLGVAIDPHFPVTKTALGLVSLLFVALGLVMPRVRRNPILGVRTAWTLTSDENWARTHRVSGYTMVGGGLVAGVATLAGGRTGAAFALACLVMSGLVPVLYSFLLARKSDQRT
jgi:uncharacterized membrane protein